MILAHIRHKNGTLSATPNIVTIVSFNEARTHSLCISNSHATASLLVSFDEGDNYFTLGSGKAITVEVFSQPNVYLKSSTSSVTYEILVGDGVV